MSVVASAGLARIGRTELGEFRLIGSLGRGSFAEAYLAEQSGTSRHAVVKIAHPSLVLRPDGDRIRELFELEVRASTRIHHPNIATVYSAGETSDGLPALAMEFIPGDTLESNLSRAAPLSVPELQYFGQLSSVLATLHRYGIVHCDVSPRNVLVTRNHDGSPTAKLVDFGIARIHGFTGGASLPMGTPRYAAPEQVRGQAKPASDMYGLGAMLWWALTGEPFLRELATTEAIIERQQAMASVPDPRHVREEIAPSLAALSRELLAPVPEDRPTSEALFKRWPGILETAREWDLKYNGHLSSDSKETLSRTLRLLVVDPEPVKRYLVTSFAERVGCDVTVLERPRDAVRGNQGEHDVALLGTELGDVDVVELARYLRANYPAQRVALMSKEGDRVVSRNDASADLALTVPGELLRLADYLGALQKRSTAGGRTAVPTLDTHEDISRAALGAWRGHPREQLEEAVKKFLGDMPEHLAILDDLRTAPTSTLSVSTALLAIERDSEALGVLHLARLARSMHMLLDEGVLGRAEGFLSELEKEYQRVFRPLMALLDEGRRS